MSDDAFIYLASDTHAPIGAPLTAIGRLDCMETPAVMGWLQAHGVTSASSKVRILPPEAGPVIPEQAERLPVPLSPEETQVVRQACAPSATGNVEAELIEYRRAQRIARYSCHEPSPMAFPLIASWNSPGSRRSSWVTWNGARRCNRRGPPLGEVSA